MADSGGMDIDTHRATFQRFWDWAKWGTLVCAVLAAIVVVIIA
jgi:Bacterial aa3 type cytochrome c oxidase subunit IV